MTTRRFVNAMGALALVMAASWPAFAQERSIRIATEGAYPPHNFVDAQGKLAGFEIDLANDLCARMKAKCEIVQQAWDGLIPGLNAGRYDAIMASMIITERRKQALDFAGPYVESANTFYTIRSSAVASLGRGPRINVETQEADFNKQLADLQKALKGKKIGVGAASTSLTFVERHFKDTLTIQQYKTFEQQDLDLAAGRIDLASAQLSYITAQQKRPEGKDIVLIGPSFVRGMFGEGPGVGIKKGDTATKALFDPAIQAAKADGTIKRLTEKWFNADLTPQ
jgi:octopine/nopaline transport system substrate-binding protein